MTVFICIDDNKGMLFNHRRQSRDAAVLKDMLDTAGGKIWMNAYSSKLFGSALDSIIIEEDFFECAAEDSYCFLENIPLEPYEEKLDCIIAYCWNRVYPADTYLDIDLNENWEAADTKEFGGTSHEKITRKTFRHKNR